MNDPLTTFCEFASKLDFESLPRDVKQQAKLVTADTIGAIVGGSAEPEMRLLTNAMLGESVGKSSVLGDERRTSNEVASFLNGCAGTFLELDEGNRFSRGHPAIHVLPALLSVAETTRSTGSAFLRALVIGYEVSARIAIGSKLRPSTHPHGTWGTVGAAAALASLCAATPVQMREVINVAATLGLANSAQSMYEGALVRNSFAGFSARNGATAWQLVKAGFTGERDALASVWGTVLSDEWRAGALSEQLGTRWEVTRNYFKLHACCRYNHAALDALAKITRKQTITAQDVERVDVDTYSMAASLDETAPKNTLAGKFSVPFSIATTLVHGNSSIASFDVDAIRNAQALALAKRVQVREDVNMTSKLPAQRSARVSVILKSGERLEAVTHGNRGDFDDPYELHELEQKFHMLVSRVRASDVAESVWRRVQLLDELDDINTLTGLLAGNTQGSESIPRVGE